MKGANKTEYTAMLHDLAILNFKYLHRQVAVRKGNKS
jgi:hypothetical protein